MSKNILPRRSKKNTLHAMRTLAVAKLLKSTMKVAEDQAKAYLIEKEMQPKDRRTVVGPNDAEIGTISLTQPARKRGTGLKIYDPIALATWCDEKGITHGGTPSVVFPEWFTAEQNLEALIQMGGGEMPDGVEDTTEPGEPYIVVRQTQTQAENVLEGITTARGLIEAVSPTLTEEEPKK